MACNCSTMNNIKKCMEYLIIGTAISSFGSAIFNPIYQTGVDIKETNKTLKTELYKNNSFEKMNEIYKNNKVDINLNKLKNYSLDGAKYGIFSILKTHKYKYENLDGLMWSPLFIFIIPSYIIYKPFELYINNKYEKIINKN